MSENPSDEAGWQREAKSGAECKLHKRAHDEGNADIEDRSLTAEGIGDHPEQQGGAENPADGFEKHGKGDDGTEHDAKGAPVEPRFGVRVEGTICGRT